MKFPYTRLPNRIKRPIIRIAVEHKGKEIPYAEPWADTGPSTGRLMLAVLGGLADVERDLAGSNETPGFDT